MTEKKTAETAVEREANDIETVQITVEIRGKALKFDVPADVDDVPFDAALDMENGRLRSAVVGILGERQAMKLRQAGATKRDIENLTLELNEAWGLGED